MYTGKTIKAWRRQERLQEAFQWALETVCTMAIGIAMCKLAIMLIK